MHNLCNAVDNQMHTIVGRAILNRVANSHEHDPYDIIRRARSDIFAAPWRRSDFDILLNAMYEDVYR